MVVKSKNKIHSQVNTNIQLEMECYTLKPMSIFLEILFLFGLIIYIVYVFVIKKKKTTLYQGLLSLQSYCCLL